MKVSKASTISSWRGAGRQYGYTKHFRDDGQARHTLLSQHRAKYSSTRHEVDCELARSIFLRRNHWIIWHKEVRRSFVSVLKEVLSHMSSLLTRDCVYSQACRMSFCFFVGFWVATTSLVIGSLLEEHLKRRVCPAKTGHTTSTGIRTITMEYCARSKWPAP